MTKRFVLCILAVLTCFLLVNASELNLNDMESIKISLLPESEGPLLVSDKDKPILRYGFHRTQDCQNFEKAFICVRKCLDLDYQIAHADKTCVCTCYKNSVIAKYKAPIGSTKWKLGAPTTSIPPWAGGNGEKRPNDYEVNANFTEFNEDSDEAATTAIADDAEESSGEPTTTDIIPTAEDSEDVATEAEPAAVDGEKPDGGDDPEKGKKPDEGEKPGEVEKSNEGEKSDEGKKPDEK